MQGKDALKAELIMCLRSVQWHHSLNSHQDMGDTLRKAFSDSLIAKSYQCSYAKASYLINFGLGPFFQQTVKNALLNSPKIVLFFDESFNNITNSKQMDVHVRYWAKENDQVDILFILEDCKLSTFSQVETRYVTSAFLGHASASDLLDAFVSSIAGISLEKIIQVIRLLNIGGLFESI